MPASERNLSMAIYHCSIKIIKRSQGRSAVAAAAYRSGQKLTNEWDGITHDYTKKGGIVHSEILLPAHAPPEFSDRSTLWNSVEKIEKSRNAQLAREIEIALPAEIDRHSQIRLVRKYVQDIFVSAGMCADFSIHDKGDGNPHAHIMLTLRPLLENSEWGAKCRKEYNLDGLNKRLSMWKQYSDNEPVRQRLTALKSRAQEKFQDAHSAELALYDAAMRYLNELKASGEKITPKHWQTEAERLTARNSALYQQMKAMRTDIQAVEKIRKTADELARAERDKEKGHDFER